MNPLNTSEMQLGIMIHNQEGPVSTYVELATQSTATEVKAVSDDTGDDDSIFVAHTDGGGIVKFEAMELNVSSSSISINESF